MIAKLECFSGHCHIAPDRVGLARSQVEMDQELTPQMPQT